MTLTPNEEVRAAATLMRERALTASPGPWGVYDAQTVYSKTTEGSQNEPDVADCYRNLRGERGANADHIAAADPITMLAVADWLEVTAANWLIPDLHDEHQPCPDCRLLHAALKVARTYLAREGEH